MKKVLLVVLMLIITATVANAASSINGDYKGNPIVKVKSSGKELTVENTPAIIFNGNTLVPIYMLRQLGVEVAWDQKTYSVNVNIPNDSANTYEMEKLKLIIRIIDSYKRLQGFGETINGIGDSLSLFFRAIDGKYKVVESSKMVEEKLQYTNETLKKFRAETLLLTIEANKYGFVLENVYPGILSSFEKSINTYEYSYESLSKYRYSYSNKDFDDYLTYSSQASDEAFNTLYRVMDLYKLYVEISQL